MYSTRDKALVKLGVNVGLRATNLTRLRVGQVWDGHQPRRFLRLRAAEMKSRRGHVIPLNGSARDTIEALVRHKSALGEPLDPEAPLFLSRQGGPVSVRRVQQVLGDAAQRAGLDGGVASHSLRKSFATRLLDAGVNLRVIQELLGHRELATTASYLGVGPRALEESVRAIES